MKYRVNTMNNHITLDDIYPYSITNKLASRFSRHNEYIQHIQLDVISTPHDVLYRVTVEYDVVLETTHIKRVIDKYNTL